MTHLPVAVDAMGGDLGPGVVVLGAVRAFENFGIPSILVGDEKILREELSKFSSEIPISIQNAEEVITMEDSPSAAIRKKPKSSIRVAFQLVKDKKACAVVSPGNTGAVMAAGLYTAGTLPGIARPAIATLLPKVGDALPTVFLDSGANVDCDAAHLVQFALMGHCYAQVALKTLSPRVALLSNGSELSKGTDTIRAAAMMLSELKDINFIGYIEGRDLPRDVVDVVICDGFLGNVLLKTMEGSVELVVDSMRHYVGKTLRGKLGLWLAKPLMKSLFKDKLDPSTYGGAPLLGLKELAIICHGSSNSRAIKNAIRVGHDFSKEGLVSRIEQALIGFDSSSNDASVEEGLWDRMGTKFDKKKKKFGFKAEGEVS